MKWAFLRAWPRHWYFFKHAEIFKCTTKMTWQPSQGKSIFKPSTTECSFSCYVTSWSQAGPHSHQFCNDTVPCSQKRNVSVSHLDGKASRVHTSTRDMGHGTRDSGHRRRVGLVTRQESDPMSGACKSAVSTTKGGSDWCVNWWTL